MSAWFNVWVHIWKVCCCISHSTICLVIGTVREILDRLSLTSFIHLLLRHLLRHMLTLTICRVVLHGALIIHSWQELIIWHLHWLVLLLVLVLKLILILVLILILLLLVAVILLSMYLEYLLLLEITFNVFQNKFDGFIRIHWGLVRRIRVRNRFDKVQLPP